jgi:hypothetical protein
MAILLLSLYYLIMARLYKNRIYNFYKKSYDELSRIRGKEWADAVLLDIVAKVVKKDITETYKSMTKKYEHKNIYNI